MPNHSGVAVTATPIRLLLILLAPLLVAAAVAAAPRPELAQPNRHEIEMRGFEFQPAVLRVKTGDTIVWINRDFVPHTATAGTVWDTGKVEPKAAGSWVVRGKGELAYICTYHPSMRGKLVVR